MQVVCLHAKEAIAAFARRNPLRHLYELGDLDDFFWPHTIWFAWADGQDTRQLALLYTDLSLPVLLAHSDPPMESMPPFLRALVPLLPRRFYAHLSLDAAEALADAYQLEFHGVHHKMGLRHVDLVSAVDTSSVVQLTESDLAEVERLYNASYPEHWFVPRMLQTGFYFGVRDDHALLSVAGVHVYAPAYGVAALGNVTTHPAARGRGLATATCAGLCQALVASGIATIGPNVKADNAAAVRAYEKLGFERVGDYGEYTLESK